MNCISCEVPFVEGELFIPSGRDDNNELRGRHEDCIETLKSLLATARKDTLLLDFLTFGMLDAIARRESLQRCPTVREAIRRLKEEMDS